TVWAYVLAATLAQCFDVAECCSCYALVSRCGMERCWAMNSLIFFFFKQKTAYEMGHAQARHDQTWLDPGTDWWTPGANHPAHSVRPKSVSKHQISLGTCIAQDTGLETRTPHPGRRGRRRAQRSFRPWFLTAVVSGRWRRPRAGFP